MSFSVGVPPGFRFKSVVLSHGWSDLAPFSADPDGDLLTLQLVVGGRKAVTTAISPRGRSLSIDARSRTPITASDRAEIRTVVRSVFRLDADLLPFYRETGRHPEFAWVPKLGAGRLLRAPTAFEDTVKLICTTNCSWSLTKIMVRNLCDTLGRGPDGARSFPTPAAMADATEAFYRKEIRCGYRAPYLLELSRRVADGSLGIERWRDLSIPSAVVRGQIASVKGVGPYAAGNLLKLIGRYGELGIDSWCRKHFGRIHRGGRRVSDAAIERHYRGFGEWKGLFFWLDLTKEWYEKPYAEVFGQ